MLVASRGQLPGAQIGSRRQCVPRDFLRGLRQPQLPRGIFRIQLRDAFQAEQRVFFARFAVEKLRRLGVLLDGFVGVILFLLQKSVARDALRRLLHRIRCAESGCKWPALYFRRADLSAYRTAIRNGPPPDPAAPCANTNLPAPGWPPGVEALPPAPTDKRLSHPRRDSFRGNASLDQDACLRLRPSERVAFCGVSSSCGMQFSVGCSFDRQTWPACSVISLF